jgi:hypothetical protein
MVMDMDMDTTWIWTRTWTETRTWILEIRKRIKVKLLMCTLKKIFLAASQRKNSDYCGILSSLLAVCQFLNL